MNRTRITATSGICTLAVLVAACSSTAETSPEASQPAAGTTTEASEPTEADWSYDGVSGPAEWAELDEQYRTCGTGLQQSPVDLPSAALPGGGALDLTGQPEQGGIVDTGHTIQLTGDEDASEVTLDGRSYDLVQMHVHTPSEHTVDGVAAAAEFHFVHRSEDGHLLVIGVLGVEGEPSAAFDPFVQGAVGEADTATLDMHAMLPGSLDHVAYEGSLTTPPCTEGVRWVVMTTPVELSAPQLAELNVAHPGNTRPVQPLGDREVVRATATWVDAVDD